MTIREGSPINRKRNALQTDPLIESSPNREETMFTHRNQLHYDQELSESSAYEHKTASMLKWSLTNIRDYALFGYFTPYMYRATYQGGAVVVPEFLPPLKKRDNLDIWSSRFTKAANLEWNRTKGTSRFALFRALLRVFWKHLFGIFFLKFLKIALDILASRSLRSYVSSEEVLEVIPTATARTKEGCLGTCLFRSMLMSPVLKYNNTEDHQIRTVREQANIYNLLTVDVPSIARSILLLIDIIMLPIGVYFYFRELKYNVGASAEAGLYGIGVVIAVLLVLELYNAYLKKPLLHWRDVRLQQLHNAIVNIRSLRLVGWESHAMEEVVKARNRELSVRRVRMYAHGVSWAVSDCSRYIVQLIIFTSYIMLAVRANKDVVFRASVIMPTLQLVIRLMGPLTDTSFLLHSLLEGFVSCVRYQAHVFGYTRRNKISLFTRRRFSEDSVASVDDHHHYETASSRKPLLIKQDIPAFVGNAVAPYDARICITVNQAVFSWSSSTSNPECFTVTVPHLQVCRAQCVIVLGHPGHGKTSFISALLGEMYRVEGTAKVRRCWQPICNEDEEVIYPVTSAEKTRSATAVGYTSQIPWLPEGTVQHAIVLGRLFDEARYNRVIETCQLAQDFASWAEGDQRLIVQDGMTLSAGQRVRISLARALYDYPLFGPEINNHAYTYADKHGYQGSSVFLLDNIFSSLDPSVGFQIFSRLLYDEQSPVLHGATVITVDQRNLMFYLNMAKQTNKTPAVDLMFKTIENGVMSDFDPYQSAYFTLVASQDHTASAEQFMHLLGEPTKSLLPSLTSTPEQSHIDTQLCSSDRIPTKDPHKVESPHEGVIGCKVYWFYFRKCGLMLSTFTLLLSIVLVGQRMGSELWIAHWSGMGKGASFSKTAPVTIVPPSPQVASMHFPVNKPYQDELNTFKEPRNNTDLVDDSTDADFEDKEEERGPPERPNTRHFKKYQETSLESPNLKDHGDTTENDASLAADAWDEDTKLVDTPLASTPVNAPDVDETYTPLGSYLALLLPQALSTNTALKFFIWLSASIVVMALIVTFLITNAGLRGARLMHRDLLSGVIKAPFWIYDSLPVGLIINRFNTDVQAIDTAPGLQLSRLVMDFAHLFFVIFFLCLLRPGSLIIVPIVIWFVYSFIYRLYRPSCREFQRSVLLAWSPLTGAMAEVETGNVVIRALGAQTYYVKRNIFLTSELLKVQFMQNGIVRWGTTRFQLLASTFSVFNSVVPLLLGCIGLKTYASRGFDTIFSSTSFVKTSAFLGLATTYAMELPSCVRDIVLNTTTLDRSMCSVQRVKAMIQLTEEAQSHAKASCHYNVKHVSQMPRTHTGLKITNVNVSYRVRCEERMMRHLYKTSDIHTLQNSFFPPSIKDLNCFIKPGEHVGVIGRTGAGKSTLLLSIMGFAPVTSGGITLDGVSLDHIHPHVREKLIAVLPQIPVVIKGWTVRRFLDPDGKHSCAELYSALAKVRMTELINHLPDQLDTVIINDEHNLTVPATQSTWKKDTECNDLVSLTVHKKSESAVCSRWLSDSQLRILSIARLSLTSSSCRLVLMDEPPVKQLENPSGDEYISDLSAVQDVEIGPLLRQLFPKMTVIIAAHYASTIQHCDTVWVISHGKLQNRLPGKIFDTQEKLSYYIQQAETVVEQTVE